MDASPLIEYLGAAKTIMDIFKGIRSELPKGPKSDQLGAEIERAETALRASEAKLAKDLGFHLCDCTFPPQIMLRREKEGVRMCPNPECGHQDDLFRRGGGRGPTGSWQG